MRNVFQADLIVPTPNIISIDIINLISRHGSTDKLNKSFFFLWVWCDMSQVGLASTAANRRRCMARTREGHGGNGRRGPTRPNILPWIIPTSEGDARFTTSPCRLVREKPLPPWFLSLGKSVCAYIYSLSLLRTLETKRPLVRPTQFCERRKAMSFSASREMRGSVLNISLVADIDEQNPKPWTPTPTTSIPMVAFSSSSRAWKSFP